MKRLPVVLLAMVFALGLAGPVQAQVSVAPEVAFGEDVDLGIGAHVAAPLTAVDENLELAARFNLFFPDGFDYWEINGDARYLFPLPDNDQVVPYALGGLAFGNYSFDFESELVDVDDSTTEFGLRLGGGVKFPMDRFHPFAELGAGIGDVPDFVLRGGVSFPLGG